MINNVINHTVVDNVFLCPIDLVLSRLYAMSRPTFPSSMPSSKANGKAFDIEEYFVCWSWKFALITVGSNGSEYPLLLAILLTPSWLCFAQDDHSPSFCRRLGYNGHLHYEICVELGDQFVPSPPPSGDHHLTARVLLIAVGFVVALALTFRSSTAYERYIDGIKFLPYRRVFDD